MFTVAATSLNVAKAPVKSSCFGKVLHRISFQSPRHIGVWVEVGYPPCPKKIMVHWDLAGMNVSWISNFDQQQHFFTVKLSSPQHHDRSIPHSTGHKMKAWPLGKKNWLLSGMSLSRNLHKGSQPCRTSKTKSWGLPSLKGRPKVHG